MTLSHGTNLVKDECSSPGGGGHKSVIATYVAVFPTIFVVLCLRGVKSALFSVEWWEGCRDGGSPYVDRNACNEEPCMTLAYCNTLTAEG